MKTKQPKDYFAETFPLKTLWIDGCEISYEQTGSSLYEQLSSKDKDAFPSLLEEVQIRPKSAYEQVLKWKDKYPRVPEFDNLLTYVYLQNKQTDKAEKLIEESFHKYPNYFFAKINYADQVLRQKNVDTFKEIFPSFALKELFPKRKTFHVSEFRGFMVTISHYYLLKEERDKAKEYYQKAFQADPAHPSVIFLEKKLFPVFFLKKIWKRILKLARIS